MKLSDNDSPRTKILTGRLEGDNSFIRQNSQGFLNHFYHNAGMLSIKLEGAYLSNGPPQQKDLEKIKANRVRMDKLRQVNANPSLVTNPQMAEDLYKQLLDFGAQIEEISTTNHAPHTINCRMCKLNDELFVLMNAAIESWDAYVRSLIDFHSKKY